MLLSTLAAGFAIFSVPMEQPVYEAQLEAVIGQPYTAAVEMLGLPVRRDLRDGGGEIWVFRTRSDGGAVPAELANSSGNYLEYRSAYEDRNISRTSTAVPSQPRAIIRICTTRIALEPDGTVAGFAYQGACRPR